MTEQRSRRHGRWSTLALLAGLIAALVAGWPLGAASARATPTLTLVPDRGPCAVAAPAITARGRDFPAGQTIGLLVRRQVPFSDQAGEGGTAVVAADGTFTTELRLVTCEPRDIEGAQFSVTAHIREDRDLGPILASATFTKSSPASRSQCFAETGQCVQGRFLAYWETYGGLTVNGYPLTREFQEQLEDGNSYVVQYFERVRLEYHPEHTGTPYEVLLGQFGRRIHPADPPAPREEGAIYFAETGHNLSGRFRAYWQQNGDLRQFGYPLSEVFEEQLEDGNTYSVQYFERARFEYHPEYAGTRYEVLLGQFGRRMLKDGVR